MQGRIISGAKNIWKTIKNEIFGPKISNKNLNIKIKKIKEKKANFNTKIRVCSDKKTIKIRNLNDNFEKEINDISFPNNITKCNLFKQSFKLGSESFNFASEISNIKKLKINLFKININKKELETNNNKSKYKILNEKIQILPKVKKDKKLKIINNIPKKIRSEHLGRYSKQELIRILKRVKMKKPKLDLTSFSIEAFFKDLPVESIQNLKYDNKKREISLYFNSKKTNKNFRDFVIFKNKLDRTNVKIFI